MNTNPLNSYFNSKNTNVIPNDIDIFEELLSDDGVSFSDLAEMVRMQRDPEYLGRNNPQTFWQRKQKRDAERKEKEERIKNATRMDLPIDFENPYEKQEDIKNVFIESISDALVYCYNEKGKVDIEYISAITGADYKTVINELNGSILQNPETWNECFYKGWERSEDYLTGNLIRKYMIAKRACRTYNNWFEDNLKAIEAILPKNVFSENFFVHIATPCIPVSVHDEFLQYLFGKPIRPYNVDTKIKHDEKTGTWDVPVKSLYKNNPEAYSKYGTRRMSALEIYERTLNSRPIKVTDEYIDPITHKKSRIVNQAETLLAVEKQKLLEETFRNWIFSDSQRKQQLQLIFAEKYGYYRKRKFDGSFLTFPGLNKEVELYKYQKDAVARIIFSPNVLLSHDVGSGKTYIMVCAGMELKRMGLSKKNLYVVPNNILGQWLTIFKTLYKNANVLCVEPKDFTPAKKESTLLKIRDNNYDGIIMPYSVFDKIPVSKKWVCDRFLEEEETLEKYAKNWSKNTSGIKHAQNKLKDNTRALLDKVNKYNAPICFDELGITRLFVDEAHNYKNVPVDTNTSGIRGISNVGSLKCEMMLEKVRFVQKQNNGAGVVMATGTPLTNSVTDAFVMQTYLQSGELALLDVNTFDAWIGMFAEAVTDFEIDVDTSNYRLATRLSQFHNMSELSCLLSSIADFHNTTAQDDVPIFNGYTDHLIPQTLELKNYLKLISKRADDIHRRRVPPTEDNMLLLTIDGRKAALDIRLVDDTLPLCRQSKVYVCAEEVYKIYVETAEKQATQLIFCDSSVPSDNFNMYDELFMLLRTKGVPESQIAYIHNAKTDKQREKLFANVRAGKIRILIGSTLKLGMGVNVQDKLIAIHHLDVPWRPADMVQRQGRIIRQGNTNPEVFIHRYITQGSFDAYSWQLLEVKQRFINEILAGSLDTQIVGDIDDTVLDYAEVKALAVGNPLLKKRVDTANELSRLITLQRKAREEHELLRKDLFEIPSQVEYYTARIKEIEQDVAFVTPLPKSNETSEERKAFRKKLFDAVSNNVLETNENSFAHYRGFEIILPAHMLKDRSYVYLKRAGRYRVEFSDNEKGNLIRLDNAIDGLNVRLSRFNNLLNELLLKEKNIKLELSKTIDYSEQIESYRKLLKDIDKELGVIRDE